MTIEHFLSQTFLMATGIWIVVQALRKCPFGLVRNMANIITGETIAFGVGVVFLVIALWLKLIPPNLSTIVQILIAIFGAEIGHDKILGRVSDKISNKIKI